MKKIVNILSGIIVKIAIIFISLAMICSFIGTFIGWDTLGWADHDPSYFFIPKLYRSIIVFIVLFCGWACFRIRKFGLFERIHLYVRNTTSITKDLILFIIAFVNRFSYCLFVKHGPFSDFAEVWNIANGNYDALSYKSLFASWLNYSCLEYFFVKIIGNHSYTYIAFISLLCVISSLSIVIFYQFLREINTDESQDTISFIGCLIWSFYASSAVFIVTSAPDILVTSLNLCGIYYLGKSSKSVFESKEFFKRLIYPTIAGLFLGLSASFKSFSIIILVAFFISLILQALNSKNIQKLRYIFLFLTVLCVCVPYKLTNICAKSITEKIFRVKLDYSSATPHYFLVGLNTEGEGQIHIGSLSRVFYKLVIDENASIDDAKTKVKLLLKKDWSNNHKSILPLFLKKFVWGWQDDTIPSMYYTKYMVRERNSVIDYLGYYILPTICQASYFIMLILTLVGLLSEFRQNKLINCNQFLLLIILGFVCLLFISEAQSRYKYLIMPMISYFASQGVCFILGSKIKNAI